MGLPCTSTCMHTEPSTPDRPRTRISPSWTVSIASCLAQIALCNTTICSVQGTDYPRSCRLPGHVRVVTHSGCPTDTGAGAGVRSVPPSSRYAAPQHSGVGHACSPHSSQRSVTKMRHRPPSLTGSLHQRHRRTAVSPKPYAVVALSKQQWGLPCYPQTSIQPPTCMVCLSDNSGTPEVPTAQNGLVFTAAAIVATMSQPPVAAVLVCVGGAAPPRAAPAAAQGAPGPHAGASAAASGDPEASMPARATHTTGGSGADDAELVLVLVLVLVLLPPVHW